MISDLAMDYESKGTVFETAQIHFHSPSEHTINGKHFDLEMHVFNIGKSNGTEGPGDSTLYSVVGIMFSVEEYNRDITPGQN